MLELIFFAAAVVITFGAFLVLFLIIPRQPLNLFTAEKTIKIDDWEIHYTLQGEGPTVLLIHGIGSSLYTWDELIPLLKTRFKVVALDLPGFGRSSKITEAQYGLDQQVERITAFLDKLKIRNCYVVGNSMGGNLALWLGKTQPERFPYVVAIAPAAHPRLVPPGAARLGFLSKPAALIFNELIATWMNKRTLGRPEQMKHQHVHQSLSIYRRNPKAIRTLLRATKAITDPRIKKEIFDGRVLVLWGQRDRLVPRWTIDKLVPRLPNGRLEVHPEGGHQLQRDFPQWVHDRLVEFFPQSESITTKELYR